MPTSKEISEILFKRLIGGKLTADENFLLESWIALSPDSRRKMVDSLEDVEGLRNAYRLRSLIDSRRPKEEMERRLGIFKPDSIPAKQKSNAGIFLKWSAAAVITGVITLGGIYLFRTPSITSDRLAVAEEPVSPLQIESLSPGTSRAVLTTSAGDTLHITDQKGVPYTLPATANSGSLQVDVPRGGEFLVVLEDSTRVWLNSESSLRYPAHFSAAARRVELTGEAYFDVTHNPDVPFIVESANQRVKVYGTEFNVRAYPEDDMVYTSLSSGSISLSPLSGGGEIFLSPGKQTVFTKATSEAKVRPIDIERVTGWRHGRFVFEEQSLRQIMRDLARWYDFEYEFADEKAAETIFMGSIPRYSKFKTAIAILEKSGGLSFVVKDNRILISSKK
ncbi:MAG: FecR domain-containing protein [Muribaculaceae bacterium]|nr:FecR domain-containing protein [Muribaculaceae bacterium]